MKSAEYAEPRKRRLEEFKEKVRGLIFPQNQLPDEFFSCPELKSLNPEIQELYHLRFGEAGRWVKYGGKAPWLEDFEMAHLEKCVSCQYDLLRC